jgi:hypothetical protein
MEILFEILLWFLQFSAELLLQVVFEALLELGLHAIKEPFRWPRPNPWIAAIGYVIFGAIAGAISLLAFPSHFIASYIGRIANIFATPLIAGCIMAILGAWRRRRGDEVLRVDRFAYGFLFALAMALVRFTFARG